MHEPSCGVRLEPRESDVGWDLQRFDGVMPHAVPDGWVGREAVDGGVGGAAVHVGRMHSQIISCP